MHKAFVGAVVSLFLAPVSPVSALDTGVPSTGLPTAATFSSTLLAEHAGVVSWKTLGLVMPVVEGERIVPKFSGEILALDSKDVRVEGFMLPLDLGDQQHHFLLSAVPPHCPFCLPAGPDALVEVTAKKYVAYVIEPVIVSGKFAVLKNDPSGVLYRLTEAESATRSP